MAYLSDGRSRRAVIFLLALLAVLLVAPWFVGDYLLSVLIVILYIAYIGQAWNIMMGFAGQLSLGHALYVGLGAYVTAALFTRFGVAPWVGMLAAMPVQRCAARLSAFSPFVSVFGRLFRDPHHRLCRICPNWFRPSDHG